MKLRTTIWKITITLILLLQSQLYAQDIELLKVRFLSSLEATKAVEAHPKPVYPFDGEDKVNLSGAYFSERKEIGVRTLEKQLKLAKLKEEPLDPVVQKTVTDYREAMRHIQALLYKANINGLNKNLYFEALGAVLNVNHPFRDYIKEEGTFERLLPFVESLKLQRPFLYDKITHKAISDYNDAKKNFDGASGMIETIIYTYVQWREYIIGNNSVSFDGALGEQTISYILDWNSNKEDRFLNALLSKSEYLSLEELYEEKVINDLEFQTKIQYRIEEEADPVEAQRMFFDELEQKGWIAGVHFVRPNNDFAKQLIAIDNAEERLKTIQKLYPLIIVTDSEESEEAPTGSHSGFITKPILEFENSKNGSINTLDLFLNAISTANGKYGFAQGPRDGVRNGNLYLFNRECLLKDSKGDLKPVPVLDESGSKRYIQRIKVSMNDAGEGGTFNIELSLPTRKGTLGFIIPENIAKDILGGDKVKEMIAQEKALNGNEEMFVKTGVDTEVIDEMMLMRQEQSQWFNDIFAELNNSLSITMNPLDPKSEQIAVSGPDGEKTVPLNFEFGNMREVWEEYQPYIEEGFVFEFGKKNLLENLTLKGKKVAEIRRLNAKYRGSEVVESITIKGMEFQIVNGGFYKSDDEIFDFKEELLEKSKQFSRHELNTLRFYISFEIEINLYDENGEKQKPFEFEARFPFERTSRSFSSSLLNAEAKYMECNEVNFIQK